MASDAQGRLMHAAGLLSPASTGTAGMRTVFRIWSATARFACCVRKASAGTVLRFEVRARGTVRFDARRAEAFWNQRFDCRARRRQDRDGR